MDLTIFYNDFKKFFAKFNGFKPFEQSNTNKPATGSFAYSAISAATKVLAANANRKGASFCNNCDKDVYLLLGTDLSTITTTNFTVILKAATTTNISYFEVPEQWIGEVYAIIAAGAAAGTLNVTELT